MSSSGPPVQPPSAPAVSGPSVLTPAESKASLVSLPDALKTVARPQRVEGEVIRRDGDTITIHTDKGDIEARIRGKDAPAPGAKVEIDLSTGRPPRQAIVRTVDPPPSSQPASGQPVSDRPQTPQPVPMQPQKPQAQMPDVKLSPPAQPSPDPSNPGRTVQMPAGGSMPPAARPLPVVPAPPTPAAPLAPTAQVPVPETALPVLDDATLPMPRPSGQPGLQTPAVPTMTTATSTSQAVAPTLSGPIPSQSVPSQSAPSQSVSSKSSPPVSTTAPQAAAQAYEGAAIPLPAGTAAPSLPAQPVTLQPGQILNLTPVSPQQNPMPSAPPPNNLPSKSGPAPLPGAAQTGSQPASGVLFPAQPGINAAATPSAGGLSQNQAPSANGIAPAAPAASSLQNMQQAAQPSAGLRFKIIDILPPAMPTAASSKPGATLPAPNFNVPTANIPTANMPMPRPGQITAVVTGFTPQGQPVLGLPPGGTVQQVVLPSPAPGLSLGTRLILSPAPSAPEPSGIASPPPAPGFAWPEMDEMAASLRTASPPAAAALIQSIPNPGQTMQMPAAALMFVAAMRGGDISSWVGDKTIDSLRKLGKLEVLDRLGREISATSRAPLDPLPQEWRGMTMPLIYDGQMQRAMLWTRQENEDKDGEKDRKKPAATRFVFDLKLSRMGPVQIDGLAKQQSIDLILRTEKPVGQAMRQYMRQRYARALGQAQFTGEIEFQDQIARFIKFEVGRPNFTR